MIDFFKENALYFFLIFYFMGAFVYYKILFEEITKRNFSNIKFEDIFYDAFLITFWLPLLVVNIIRAAISGIYFAVFKFINFISFISSKTKKKKKE